MSRQTGLVLHASRKGWFTNDSQITDPSTNSLYADVHYSGLIETGSITYSSNHKHDITHTVASGVWRMLSAHDASASRAPLITAKKPKAWSRRMELSVPHHGKYVLEPCKRCKVNFVVYRADHGMAQVGALVADSEKRKGYTLSFDGGLPEHVPVFCYWLANMLNRRDKFDDVYEEGLDLIPF